LVQPIPFHQRSWGIPSGSLYQPAGAAEHVGVTTVLLFMGELLLREMSR
jgi:hypothetical protein